MVGEVEHSSFICDIPLYTGLFFSSLKTIIYQYFSIEVYKGSILQYSKKTL